jgi:hypothetical protein
MGAQRKMSTLHRSATGDAGHHAGAGLLWRSQVDRFTAFGGGRTFIFLNVCTCAVTILSLSRGS